MFQPTCPVCIHLEVRIECAHCGADTPVRDATRARLAPEGWPAVELDLCPACYQDGPESGILDQPRS